MNLLADTHTLLWWFSGSPRLSGAARTALADPDNRVFVSLASVWEVAIKHGAGRLQLPEEPGAYFRNRLPANEMELLGISFEHIVTAGQLPHHHRDPFDRLLIAQAMVEGMTIVTADRHFALYDVPLIS